MDEAFLAGWVNRLRAEIPGALAILLKGSHVRGNAGPFSDVDFDVLVDDTEIDDPYPVWIVEHDGRLVHVSVAVERLDDWVRGFREVASWSFGFRSREVTRLLWVARRSLVAELDRPWREHPAAEPEIEDFIEELGKARNAAMRGDEVSLRLAVQELAELAPTLLAPLNEPRFPGTRPEAMAMALDLETVPNGYRRDMLECLGLSGRGLTTDEVLAAGERLVMETLAQVEANIEVFEPLVKPRFLGLVRDGTMRRYLEQEAPESAGA
jgi:hypothetical protein